MQNSFSLPQGPISKPHQVQPHGFRQGRSSRLDRRLRIPLLQNQLLCPSAPPAHSGGSSVGSRAAMREGWCGEGLVDRRDSVGLEWAGDGLGWDGAGEGMVWGQERVELGCMRGRDGVGLGCCGAGLQDPLPTLEQETRSMTPLPVQRDAAGPGASTVLAPKWQGSRAQDRECHCPWQPRSEGLEMRTVAVRGWGLLPAGTSQTSVP